MRRVAPLSVGEASWLSAMVVFTVAAGLMFFGLPAPSNLIGEPTPRRGGTPVRTPLPDLCGATWVSGIVGTVVNADPESRDLDRNTASCTFAEGARGDGRRVILRVARSFSASAENTKEELRRARDTFDRADATSGSATPVPGLGDAAKLTRSGDPDAASLAVLDGLLNIQITFGGSGMKPEEVQATSRRLAAEMLRILPPKGR